MTDHARSDRSSSSSVAADRGSSVLSTAAFRVITGWQGGLDVTDREAFDARITELRRAMDTDRVSSVPGAETLRTLIAKWRAQANHERKFDAPLGGKAIARGVAGLLDNCAAELEALLAAAAGRATSPQPDELIAAVANAAVPFSAYLKCCEPLKPTEGVRVSAGQFAADCAALIAAVDQLIEIPRSSSSETAARDRIAHQDKRVRAADPSDAVQRQDLRERPDTKGSQQ